MEGEDVSDLDAPGKERPLEGLKAVGKKSKKMKTAHEAAQDGAQDKDGHGGPQDEEIVRKAKAEKQREKQQRKKEKLAKQQEKVDVKKARKAEGSANIRIEEADEVKPGDTQQGSVDDQTVDTMEGISANDIEPLDVSGIVENKDSAPRSTATPSPTPESPESALSAQPSASSTSSIVPPTSAEETVKPTKDSEKSAKAPKLPKIDQEILKARLQARIDALRAARKADGIDGKPARNRQELMEARRRKEEQRKAHKKELRNKAKEDEQRAAAEAELARLRGSGSPLSTPDIFSPRSPQNNFAFGRVTFDDGQQMDPNMTTILDPHKKKGPQDTRTALQAAQKKQARINGLDEAKRSEIQEKDMWLNAKKKAHGEKVRDDTSLLKKALKRKDKAKTKSEKEWNGRIEGVQKSKEMRQKKREDNLRKRKEEKGGKGKAKGKKPGNKTKARPGFEGSFRSKAK